MGRNAGAWCALAVLSFVWGYNWIAMKIATHDATPLAIAAIRNLLGAIALLIVIAIARRPLAAPPFWPAFWLGILQTALLTGFQMLALNTGGAGKSAVLFYTMPLWTVLLAWPLLGERITAQRGMAVVLAMTGLGFELAPFSGSTMASGLFAVASALSWAASAIFVKRFMARTKVDLLALTAWQMLYGAGVLVVLVALHAPAERVDPTPSFLLAMLYIVVPATALAWWLWMFALSRLSAGRAGIASLLTPVLGVLFAWVWLGEQPGKAEMTGLGLILCALAVNAYPSKATRAA